MIDVGFEKEIETNPPVGLGKRYGMLAIVQQVMVAPGPQQDIGRREGKEVLAPGIINS